MFSPHVSTISANTTLSTNYDLYFVDCTSGNVTLTVPNTTVDGVNWVIRRTDTSTNTLAITTTSQTIDGLASINLGKGGNITILCWAANFLSFSGNTYLPAGLTVAGLADTAISSPASGEVLRYNGSTWANATDVISFNGRTGVVSPATNDYNITQLAGVTISSPSSGQILTYNGSAWVNATSAFARQISMNSGGNVSNSNCLLFGSQTATESRAQIVMNGSFTLRRLYVKATAAVAAAMVVTVRLNGANTALTATVALSGTAASDTSNTVAVVANDLVSVRVTFASNPSAGVAVSLELF